MKFIKQVELDAENTMKSGITDENITSIGTWVKSRQNVTRRNVCAQCRQIGFEVFVSYRSVI